MNIVLLGAPGSGKGTLAKQLLTIHNFFVVTPGELYRKEAAAGTEFGLKAKEYWGNGNICPDDMTNNLITKTISGINKSLIFDGYPRNYAQAKFLDTILPINLVIDLAVNDQTATNRLLNRKSLESRLDDTEEIIKARLKVYHFNNNDIINYYKQTNERYLPIDSSRHKDIVFSEIKEILTTKFKL